MSFVAAPPKTYKKIIVSGNVLEVYEAEREPYLPDKHLDPDDGFNALDIVFDPDETRDRNMLLQELRKGLDRTDERRGQTLRDARNTTRRLALMNFHSGDCFMTLTFAEHVTDVVYADKQFNLFIKRLKYHYKLDSIKYLAVRELTKKGCIHYHCLMDLHFDIPPLPDGFGHIKLPNGEKILNAVGQAYDDKYIKPLETHIFQKLWKLGWIDIKIMDSHNDNVGAYLIKYMTKNVAMEFFKGRKIYLNSQGLDRPTVFRGLEAEALFETYNLGQKKEVYTNSYISEYQGTITYKEYNLNRLN